MADEAKVPDDQILKGADVARDEGARERAALAAADGRREYSGAELAQDQEDGADMPYLDVLALAARPAGSGEPDPDVVKRAREETEAAAAAEAQRQEDERQAQLAQDEEERKLEEQRRELEDAEAAEAARTAALLAQKAALDQQQAELDAARERHAATLGLDGRAEALEAERKRVADELANHSPSE